jgi:peptidoglycan/xylan/chitin deacetylase (PgdA/CDA1 family)
LSAGDLRELLEHIGAGRLVSAQEWCERAESNALDGAVCVTFDDGLRSQFDVAAPVLEELGLTGFFFVHTSALDDPPAGPEMYRYLRTHAYVDVAEFYAEFFDAVEHDVLRDRTRMALSNFDPRSYLIEHPFYSDGDRRFRFLRDTVLTRQEYEALMDELIDRHEIDRIAVGASLWMQRDQLCDLERRGHIVGLHSHTHPMDMGRLSYKEQLIEYRTNLEVLTQVLGTRPVCMSHPANSRSDDTFRVLDELGIRTGFRAVMGGPKYMRLDLPREDCANLLTEMRS